MGKQEGDQMCSLHDVLTSRAAEEGGQRINKGWWGAGRELRAGAMYSVELEHRPSAAAKRVCLSIALASPQGQERNA